MIKGAAKKKMKNYPNVNKLFLKAGKNFESNGKVTSH